MILDLFAGPGGWDEGLRMIGRTDVIGVELDEDACATARAAGHKRICADVRNVELRNDYPAATFEGIIASPPCQPFSENGKRGGLDDPRGQLVNDALRYVEECRPLWVAFEQVKTVLPIWRQQAETLRLWGYSTWTCIVDAADYGVPQNRLRALLVARRDGAVALPPEPTHTRLRWVSQGAALGWPNPKEWVVNTGLDWKKGQPRESAQKIPGTRPASTITTRSVGQWRVYPPGENYRGLTEREAGILQTFPADYPWQGPTQLARATQIGNAIPPLLAAHILAALDVGELPAEAAA